LPTKEERLKKMLAISRKKNAQAVSISSRLLHSSVASSKVLMPFNPVNQAEENVSKNEN
jgi:hypothetical protein